jgi:hypothetical protein
LEEYGWFEEKRNTMAEQNYHWETSKENVLPLKQGRTVAAIEETFQQNSSKGKVNEKIEREKR